MTTVPKALCLVVYLYNLLFIMSLTTSTALPYFQDINSSCLLASRPVVLNQG